MLFVHQTLCPKQIVVSNNQAEFGRITGRKQVIAEVSVAVAIASSIS